MAQSAPATQPDQEPARSDLNNEKDTPKLRIQYAEVVHNLKTTLDDDESYKLHPRVALALNNVLERLGHWVDDLNIDCEQKEDEEILAMIETQHQALSCRMAGSLMVLNKRVLSMIGWQAKYAAVVERDEDVAPPGPSGWLFHDLSRALHDVVELAIEFRSLDRQHISTSGIETADGGLGHEREPGEICPVTTKVARAENTFDLGQESRFSEGQDISASGIEIPDEDLGDEHHGDGTTRSETTGSVL